MWSFTRLFIKGLFVVGFYSALVIAYFFLQEFYVENCTYRAGIIQMMLGLPACNHVLRILQYVGDYFIAIVLGLSTFTFAAVMG